MTAAVPSPSVRKLRADGQRNREALMEAAKVSFAEAGIEASLDEIARRAGVGIGTLYRHFPTREAIVEAVYRREVQSLADSAERLSQTLSPREALHQWMRLFVDYIATKKVMASALSAVVSQGTDLYSNTAVLITGAMRGLVERAVAAGEIRSDANAEDLLRAVVGFTYGAAGPGWQASALRLIDILMDGLRPA